MRARRRSGAMVLGLAVTALLLGAAGRAGADTIAFNFTGGGGHAFGDPSFTAGYTFTVNSPIDVTQLGVWDPVAGTPLTRNHPVGIWNQAGALLSSATVLPTSPKTAGFQFVPVTPFELDPGQTYTIGAFYPDRGADAGIDQPLRSNASGFIKASQLNFGTEKFALNDGGLTRPTIATPDVNPGDFGPNFQFTGVPEPSTLALLALGGGALAGWRRWRKRAAA
jgi:uncharacterized protein DUF4082/PEP-CTERM motif-containing protein